jgi:hypothetical protein
MIEEVYRLGVYWALRNRGVTKQAGAKHVKPLVGGAIGGVLGFGLGALAAPTLSDPPKGIVGLPPTRGQLEFDLKRKAQMGALLGGLAGLGLGAASPKILSLLKRLRGEQVSKTLSG